MGWETTKGKIEKGHQETDVNQQAIFACCFWVRIVSQSLMFFICWSLWALGTNLLCLPDLSRRNSSEKGTASKLHSHIPSGLIVKHSKINPLCESSVVSINEVGNQHAMPSPEVSKYLTYLSRPSSHHASDCPVRARVFLPTA